MKYKEMEPMSRCLECGEEISYGRKDKKYCSEECKNRYNNQLTLSSKRLKRRIMAALEKNYAILEAALKAGMDSVELTDLVALGFCPYLFTAKGRQKRRLQVCCFDITYVLGANRITSISKIQNVSLTLQTFLNEEGFED